MNLKSSHILKLIYFDKYKSYSAQNTYIEIPMEARK